MDSTRLAHKIALITGSNSGIGQATARRFLAEGATVITADRSPQKNPLVQAQTPGVRSLTCDVSRLDDLQAAGEWVRSEFGRLDILVNNAGVTGQPGLVHEYDPADYDIVMNTNVRGPFFMMKAMLPLMMEAGGSIVNVSSIGAVSHTPGSSPYSASKAALAMLTKQVAIDYAPHEIRANVVCPGLVETPILGGDPDVLAFLESKVPVGRLGKAEEIAATIAFLASDEARFATGAEFFIDGGHTAV